MKNSITSLKINFTSEKNLNIEFRFLLLHGAAQRVVQKISDDVRNRVIKFLFKVRLI